MDRRLEAVLSKGVFYYGVPLREKLNATLAHLAGLSYWSASYAIGGKRLAPG